MQAVLLVSSLVESIDDMRTQFNVGDTIEARIAGTDKKTHEIALTMKPVKESKEKAEKVKALPPVNLLMQGHGKRKRKQLILHRSKPHLVIC